jgi:hypothetical protein
MEPTSPLPPATTSAQLAATIEAWQLACAQGWQEPEPECLQAELSLPAADQGLLGSAWDSWSSNPYLDRQQVEVHRASIPLRSPDAAVSCPLRQKPQTVPRWAGLFYGSAFWSAARSVKGFARACGPLDRPGPGLRERCSLAPQP